LIKEQSKVVLQKIYHRNYETKKITDYGDIMKIEYFCPECDGTNVRVMCMWDKETQQWEYAEDGGDWCDDCDEPIPNELVKREIK